MHRTIRLVLAFALVGSLVSCGDDDTAAGPAGGDDGPGGPRVADVAELSELLTGVADGCTLEYEGLEDGQREVSVCTLGTEAVELSVWTDTAALDDLVAAADESGDPVVTGANWSVDVTDPSLADDVADATGGTVHP